MNLQKSSFEELFSQLEMTVAALERGGLSLEEALNMFEQGMMLTKECRGGWKLLSYEFEKSRVC